MRGGVSRIGILRFFNSLLTEPQWQEFLVTAQLRIGLSVNPSWLLFARGARLRAEYMRHEEERFAAAVEQLKTFSAAITDNEARADLAVILTGFETMRPYVGVGLRVCASDQTLEAMDRLHQGGKLPQHLWNTLMSAVDLARKSDLASPKQEAVLKPCRRDAPRHLRSSLPLGANRVKRFA